MVDPIAAMGAVLLLMLVTIATRVGGVWIMSYVEITPRIEAFLKYMAISALVSIVVPIIAAAPPRIWLAVGASALVSITTGSALGAMLTGVALAALAKSFAL